MSGPEQVSHGEEIPQKKTGYGNPPEKHQFKKGKSGNPKGRPKKAKRKKPEPDAYADTKMVSKLLQSERNRKVKVKEGGKVEEISVLEAAVRSLGVAAMKGSRLAQRDYIKLAQDSEKERLEAIGKEMTKIVEYRLHYPGAMIEIERQGLSDEIFLHHPDDMILNPETGEADVNGPMTHEDKVEWDHKIEKRQQLADEAKTASLSYSAAEEPFFEKWHLDDWHLRQKCFDIINDNLPKRYQTELAHRSMREGASQPGDQKTRHWPGE